MLELIIANYPDIILHTARIFSSVFEIMLAYLLINSFFKPKPFFVKKDYLPFFILAATVILLQEYASVGDFKYVIECVFLPVILFSVYSGKIKAKIIGSVAFAALMGISVVLSDIIYAFLSRNLSLSSSSESPFSILLTFTLSNLIMVSLAVLLSTIVKSRGDSSTLRIWMGLLLVPTVTMLIFSVFQYIIETYPLSQQITVYIYISCIGMIITNAVVFILFWFNQRQAVMKRENDILTSQLSLQETSVKNLENAYNRTRMFRHDIKNHILTMNILAENENLPEIKKYLKEMSGIIDESSYIKITGISAVDAILNEKLYEAQSDSITTSYDVTNLTKNSIKPVDMCIILSNALDNAIEANEKIEDKDSRYIKLKIHGDSTYTVISVTNPTISTPVKASGDTYKTSKKDEKNHGFGLKSIKSTAEKYDGDMLTKCEDGVFTLVIKLKADDTQNDGNEPEGR